MPQSKLIIAAAGSGKTQHIVAAALNSSKEHILITTYTEANMDSIKRKILKKLTLCHLI